MNARSMLKPCPFCGSDVDLESMGMDARGSRTLYITCRCGIAFHVESDEVLTSATGVRYRPGLDALDKWNRRIYETD